MSRRMNPDIVLLVEPLSEPAPLFEIAARCPSVAFFLLVRDPKGRLDRNREGIAKLGCVVRPNNVRIGVSGLDGGAYHIHLPFRAVNEIDRAGTSGQPVDSCSVHSAAEARIAARYSPTWVLAGTFAPTPTKPNQQALSATGFAAVVKESRCPVIAIGGIESVSRAESALFSGAAGIAGRRLGTPAFSDRLESIAVMIGNRNSTDRASTTGLEAAQ